MIETTTKPNHMGHRLKLFMDENKIKVKEVAEVFNVERPSVYDWIKFGRIDKRHYGRLVEWSKLPIEYWLDIPKLRPKLENEVRENDAVYMTPRLRTLIELFESVTKADQDEIVKSLTEKKQGYEALIKELLEKRA